MTNETLINDLQTARNTVAQGWCKHSLGIEGESVCARGAVNVAICGRSFLYPSTEAEAEEFANRSWSAESELMRHLPADVWTVPAFNDAESTTHQDVLNLFDKTLADLGGLG